MHPFDLPRLINKQTKKPSLSRSTTLCFFQWPPVTQKSPTSSLTSMYTKTAAWRYANPSLRKSHPPMTRSPVSDQRTSSSHLNPRCPPVSFYPNPLTRPRNSLSCSTCMAVVSASNPLSLASNIISSTHSSRKPMLLQSRSSTDSSRPDQYLLVTRTRGPGSSGWHPIVMGTGPSRG
jgi:hypothetical protein